MEGEQDFFIVVRALNESEYQKPAILQIFTLHCPSFNPFTGQDVYRRPELAAFLVGRTFISVLTGSVATLWVLGFVLTALGFLKVFSNSLGFSWVFHILPKNKFI